MNEQQLRMYEFGLVSITAELPDGSRYVVTREDELEAVLVIYPQVIQYTKAMYPQGVQNTKYGKPKQLAIFDDDGAVVITYHFSYAPQGWN